jgi:hypothetical protein
MGMATEAREFMPFSSGQATDVRDGAEQTLVAMTDEMYRRNLGAPGKRPNPGPSLAKLDPSTRRLVQTARATGNPVSLPVYKKLLMNAGIRGEEAVPLISSYIEATLLKDFTRCVQLFSDLFGPGETSETEQSSITITQAEFHAVIRSETVQIPSVEEELVRARRDMSKRSTMFGWITSLDAGFQILGPTPPLCLLLGLSAEELDGSYLLEDPLVGRFRELLANFDEWVLIIGMLSHSQRNTMPPGSEAALRVGRFYAGLTEYVTKYHEQIRQRLQASISSPAELQDLLNCARAAVGEVEWPPYDPDRYNAMRVYMRLPGGEVARFEKIARPITRLERIIGYEVTWSPERFDAVASSAMAAVLDQLGGLEPAHYDYSSGRGAVGEACEQLARNHAETGWIIDEERSVVLEVSPAMCKLLQADRSQLVGQNIIGEAITEIMRDSFANFYEMATIEAVLVHSLSVRFKPAHDSEIGHSMQQFLTKIKDEFACDAAQVLRELREAEVEVAGRPYRDLLLQGFEAIVNEAPWPDFHEGWLGFMPLIVRRHPLLPDGAAARFTKAVTPLTDRRPGVILVRGVPDSDPTSADFVRALSR